MTTLLRASLAALLLVSLGAPTRAQEADEDHPTAWVTEAKVQVALFDKLGADALSIRVRMDRTTAILTGEVTRRSVQELAREVALSIEGVAKVQNRLTRKRPDPGGTVEQAGRNTDEELRDAKLESRVKLQLYSELGLRARRIEVEASEGVVSLRGKVPDEARKKIALETAREVADVEKVVDLLEVEG
jgi:hyperosmotically inducible periplasmic protein